VLDPLTLDRAWPGRGHSPSHQPGRRQVALLAEIGSENPHIEVLPLYAPEPPLEDAKRGVDGDSLVVTGGCAGADRTGVGPVLPEERTHAAPIPFREAPCVSAEQMLNGVLVAAAAGGGTVLDPAPRNAQETEPERREVSAL
jgi:hypothetical protein